MSSLFTNLNPCQVAAIQLCSQQDIQKNLNAAQMLIQQASAAGCLLVVLPENFAYMGPNQRQTAIQFDFIVSQVANWARQFNVWIIAGSIPCLFDLNGKTVANNKVRSACVVLDPSGNVVGRYDKIHLFNATTRDGTVYSEGATFEAGDTPICVNTPFGKIGLSICYDLRFAPLALTLRQMGASIITAPSAFTYLTGQAHWQTLCQARALDSQCFLIAANQVGWHNNLRQTWGHSCVVHANGQMLSMLQGEHVGISSAILNFNERQIFRQNLPSFEHMRLGFTV